MSCGAATVVRLSVAGRNKEAEAGCVRILTGPRGVSIPVGGAVLVVRRQEGRPFQGPGSRTGAGLAILGILDALSQGRLAGRLVLLLLR